MARALMQMLPVVVRRILTAPSHYHAVVRAHSVLGGGPIPFVPSLHRDHGPPPRHPAARSLPSLAPAGRRQAAVAAVVVVVVGQPSRECHRQADDRDRPDDAVEARTIVSDDVLRLLPLWRELVL